MSDAIPPQLPPPIPIPAQALSYSTGALRGRPGLIVAIGILSIVTACMSGIVSFLTCVYGLIFYTFISTSSSSASPFSYVPPPTPVTTAPAPSAKLSMGEASVAVNALGSVLELDGARVRELDKMVRGHGRDILGTVDADDDVDAPPVTDPGVRESLKKHQAAKDADGAAYFVTAKGRVEIYPDRAVFVSVDGSHTIKTSVATNSESESADETVRTTQAASTEPASAVGATTQGQGTTLSAAEVRRVLKLIKKNSSKPPRAAELATIEAQLSATDQQWITPGSASPVNSVIPMQDGLLVQFELGTLKVGRQGQVLTSIQSNPFTGFANMRQLRNPLAILIAEAAASLGLAIYLLVVGILVCRSTFNSPGLLRIFAWIKIVLVFTCAGAVSWLIHNSFTLGWSSAGSTVVGWSIFWIGIAVVIGLAFPCGVLISLRSRLLRDYFKFNAI